ncbi:hypothetical protein KM043_001839 [Ampulex compressa]|nr:hypothetical protein KM043_001839 [Ampulex compressa]
MVRFTSQRNTDKPIGLSSVEVNSRIPGRNCIVPDAPRLIYALISRQVATGAIPATKALRVCHDIPRPGVSSRGSGKRPVASALRGGDIPGVGDDISRPYSRICKVVNLAGAVHRAECRCWLSRLRHPSSPSLRLVRQPWLFVSRLQPRGLRAGGRKGGGDEGDSSRKAAMKQCGHRSILLESIIALRRPPLEFTSWNFGVLDYRIGGYRWLDRGCKPRDRAPEGERRGN